MVKLMKMERSGMDSLGIRSRYKRPNELAREG